MFGGSLFDVFNNDPFFSGYQQHMQQMQQSMMGGAPRSMQPALPAAGGAPTDPASLRLQQHQQRQQLAQRDPFAGMGLGMFGGGGMFGHMDMMRSMNSMMGNMHTQMERASGDPNSHYFSQSTVMSYRNDGGQPQVYQSSSSTRQAPGGVLETHRSVRDTSQNLEKMAIGHHIGDRGHVRERKKDTQTGDIEQNEDYINIEEEEAATFDQEFRGHMQRAYPGGRPNGAVTDGRTRYASHSHHHGAHRDHRPYSRPAIRYHDQQ